jgi:microcystin-dependent protein
VLNGIPYALTGGTASFPAAPTDNRFDIVVARVTAGVAALAVVSGDDSSSNPSYPKSASVITVAVNPLIHVDLSTDVVLAACYRSGSATVTSSRIVDKRIFRTVSIPDQGTTIPDPSYGKGTGSLYFQNANVPNGTGSGVYVKRADGTWVELALNVGSHFPIGAVAAWPTTTAVPSGCLELKGQALSTATYPALFSIYGYQHGGSGGTFFLPAWDGKSIRATTNTANIGTFIGADNVTLSTANLPSHAHTLSAHTHTLSHTHNMTTGTESADHAHSISLQSGGVIDDTLASTALTPLPGSAWSFIIQSIGGPHAIDINAGSGVTVSTTPTTSFFEVGLAPEHTHITSGNTSGRNAAHTHTGTTSSQSTATTSAPSSDTTNSIGSGTSFSTIPATAYTRFIVRASLGSDASFIGDPADTVNTFSQIVDVASPAASSQFIWVAAFSCKILALRARRTGGTGAVVNVLINGVSHALTSNLSLTTTSFQTGTANGVVNLVAGDVVELEIVSVTGSPTRLIGQVDFTVVPQ